jgi:hypothetical protein
VTEPLPEDEEFTVLVNAEIPRLDLVDSAANGTRFILAKRSDGAGLLSADTVRNLIGKAAPDASTAEDRVTMTGSPAAIAKLIHQAAQRATAPAGEPVVKAKYDAADLRRMADSGAAMADGSYPVADREDLDHAIRAVGRGGADHDAIRRHIVHRADALGAESEIPNNWNADGSLKGAVEKEQAMEDPTAVDITQPLAEPETGAPGAPTVPGSPAWEAVDAATARKWTAILARAKAAVGLLLDREVMEAASGAEVDCDDAMDLDDAACAIDYAISLLAPFAVSEQAEADTGEQMQAVAKALDGWDPAPLDTIAALGTVRKAGRVLSSSNEQAIRDAVASLQ